jgi:hypothetical protein
MRLQSLAATNQARLLLGPPAITRIEPPHFTPPIRMDDWRRSVRELVPAADHAISLHGTQVAACFCARRLRDLFPFHQIPFSRQLQLRRNN